MLKFTLFGTFDAQRDGHTIDGLQNRKANLLLALLTLERNRRVPRTWIEAVLLMSYAALRQAESNLRACLGEEKGRIKVENNSLFLDLRGIQTDIVEFERLIGKGDPDSLRQCLSLYQGGLLKDWEGSWLEEKREDYQLSYLDALQTLTDAAVKELDYDRAAIYLRRSTDAYPGVNPAWKQLIEVYRLGGKIGQAEDTYKKYLVCLDKRGKEAGYTIQPLPTVEEALKSVQIPLVPAISIHLPAPVSTLPLTHFEAVGGAVPLGSHYYVKREADELVSHAIRPETSFVLIKGPRQVGKTSLLARVLEQGREKQACVLCTDWQNIPQSDLESPETFLLNIAETLVEQLRLNVTPENFFASRLNATRNFTRFLRKQVLPAVEGWLVWGIDEADRLFDCTFKDDIFGMLRSWHNERSVNPGCEWERLTVVISYATEAYLIQNLNQSPFNVGFQVVLADFTLEQVDDLNRRYGGPLRNERELRRLYALVGGHPFLVRRSLQEMMLRQWGIAEVEAQTDTGLFRDHLERMRLALLRDQDMTATVRAWLHEGASPAPEPFIRLCAAGVMAGAKEAEMHARCRLYEQYLRKVLR